MNVYNRKGLNTHFLYKYSQKNVNILVKNISKYGLALYTYHAVIIESNLISVSRAVPQGL